MLPIYCEHFNLKREPFNITPDPGFLYLSESHKEALAQLVYGIKGRRGFVVLTGEVGTGKTTLIHCLLKELNGNTKTAMVFNMVVGAKDLLRYVCEKFGITDPEEIHKEIHDYLYLLEKFLIESYRNGTNTALIIDEAQNLSPEILENVRLLSNFETANDKLLQIFLVGQPELGTRLNTAELRQLKQRIALRHHLRPLSSSDCRDYIARRLQVAGGSISIFSAQAIQLVHEYSGGIPRLVNILCDNGLLSAYALRKESVESSMIEEVAQDLQLSKSFVFGKKGVGVKEESVQNSYRRIENPRLADSGTSKTERNVVMGDTTRRPRSDSATIQSNSPSNLPADARVSSGARGDTSVTIKNGLSILSAELLDYIITTLTETMGPMASVIVREEISKMDETVKRFPANRVVELIERVTREILSESDKANCKRLMLEVIQEIQRRD